MTMTTVGYGDVVRIVRVLARIPIISHIFIFQLSLTRFDSSRKSLEINARKSTLEYTLECYENSDINRYLNNDAERMFEIYMMILSCAFYGFILGSMASLVASLDAHSKQYHEQMDKSWRT